MTREQKIYLDALMTLIRNAPDGLRILALIGDEEGIHTMQNCEDEFAQILLSTAHHLSGGNAVEDLFHEGPIQ